LSEPSATIAATDNIETLGFDPGPGAAASIEVARAGLGEPAPVVVHTPTGPQRPEGLPDKFWDDEKKVVRVEDLAKSYTELEKKGVPPVAEPAAAPVVAPVATQDGTIVKAPVAAEPAATPLTTAMEAARTEWASAGAVSEEAVVALEAAGIPREIFAIYLEGIKAQSNVILAEAHTAVGGAENYGAMSAWAAEKLTDGELDAFNNALNDPNARQTAIQGLYARYTTARPSEGTLVAPTGSPVSAGDVYEFKAQVTKDMGDPRYQNDPVFRREVEDKLMRSQVTGFSMREASSPFARPVNRR
jgi:hypothetical protein